MSEVFGGVESDDDDDDDDAWMNESFAIVVEVVGETDLHWSFFRSLVENARSWDRWDDWECAASEQANKRVNWTRLYGKRQVAVSCLLLSLS